MLVNTGNEKPLYCILHYNLYYNDQIHLTEPDAASDIRNKIDDQEHYNR